MHSPTFDRIVPPLVFLTAAALVLPGQALATPDIFFSEYLEGTQDSGFFNLALEIYNPTEEEVDATQDEIRIEIYFDGGTTPGTTIVFGESSGLLIQPGDTYVVVQWTADPALLARSDATTLVLWPMDGNDAVVLRRGGTVVDVIGQIGADPGPGGWGEGSTSTSDHTLRRKAFVCQGDSNPSDAFAPALEWTGFPIDTFDGFGSHHAECGATPIEATSWGKAKARYRERVGPKPSSRRQ